MYIPGFIDIVKIATAVEFVFLRLTSQYDVLDNQMHSLILILWYNHQTAIYYRYSGLQNNLSFKKNILFQIQNTFLFCREVLEVKCMDKSIFFLSGFNWN